MFGCFFFGREMEVLANNVMALLDKNNETRSFIYARDEVSYCEQLKNSNWSNETVELFPRSSHILFSLFIKCFRFMWSAFKTILLLESIWVVSLFNLARVSMSPVGELMTSRNKVSLTRKQLSFKVHLLKLRARIHKSILKGFLFDLRLHYFFPERLHESSDMW